MAKLRSGRKKRPASDVGRSVTGRGSARGWIGASSASTAERRVIRQQIAARKLTAQSAM